MRVLDLDMDFFLSDPCPLAPLGERPAESCAQAWSDEQVVSFLEEQCGLSAEKPVPGAIFDTHDKALAFRWIDNLAYVRNPKSHQDIPRHLLNGEGNIHLRSFISQMMEGKNGKEPVIPFDVYDDYRQFRRHGYDFVTMAQSPRYAPASADRIMEIVRRYIIEE